MDLGGMAMMGGGGPMITGQWINQRTGERVTVRDSYMDGENMFVILTNGRQLTMEEFQDYVQMSDDVYDEKGNKIGNEKPSQKKTAKQKAAKPAYDPNLVFDGMDSTAQPVQSDLQKQILAAEAAELGLNQDDSPQNYGVEPQDIPLVPKYSKVTEQEQMIMKILDKTEKPQISFNVSWDAYPNNELKMLKEYFNVTNDDIAKAIIKKYVSKEDLDNIVSEWVNKEQS